MLFQETVIGIRGTEFANQAGIATYLTVFDSTSDDMMQNAGGIGTMLDEAWTKKSQRRCECHLIFL
jgi:phosphoribosylformylglycinamidine (FGAM) synthase-like enzyme